MVVVHNGIIENYMTLKAGLQARGVRFESQTDTEVVAHLVGEAIARRRQSPAPLSPALFVEAVREALSELKGTYALGIVSADCPDVVIGARRECPLLVGVGGKRVFPGVRRARDPLPHAKCHLLARRGSGPFVSGRGSPLQY